MLRQGACTGMHALGRQHQAAVHAAGLRPHAGGQRRHDGAVCAQPAAAAVPAGDRHQQRRQHAGHGPVGPPAVCRAHHSALGAGHNPRHLWAAAHQPVGCQHSSTSWPAAQAGCLQPARHGSCQETFVRASQQRRAQGGCSSQQQPFSTVAAWSSSSSGSSSPAGASAAAAAAADAPSALNSSSTDSLDGSSSDASTTTTSRGPSPHRRVLHTQLGKLSYRMLVSYDGTAYSGWQLQSKARTIQAELERALSTVLREDRTTLCVCAAGRTDAGVHAVGQVVQFLTNVSSIDPDRLPYKLNSLLPHDIRVNWMSQTAPDFNVTVSAKHKTYHYNLDTGPCHDPLRLRYSHHVKRPVDLEAMQAAASILAGTHDFTQFSNDSVERLRRNPVKTLQRFDVVQLGPAHVRLEVQGSGFLYKQVRHMAGALLAVGSGRMQLEHIRQLLELGNSQPPGAGGAWRGYNVAAAKGLQLFELTYPAGVDDPSTLLYPDLPHDEFGRLLTRIPGSSSSVDEE